MNNEIWKDIRGYEGLYSINNYGVIMSKTGRIKKTSISNSGYHMVMLFKNCKHDNRYIHRLVAESFIPNPDNKPQVNHVDEYKSNNHVSNLEWMTAKENVNHGTRTQRSSKRIKAIYPSGESKSFSSLTECAIYFNVTVSSISYCYRNNVPNKHGISFTSEVN